MLHLYNPPPQPQTLATTDLFIVFVAFLFSKHHKIKIPQCVVFSDRLPSCSNLHIRFTHVFLWLDNLFYHWIKFHYINICLFIHPPIHLFIRFIQYLLCASYCATCWRYDDEWNRHCPCLSKASSLIMERGDRASRED